MQLNPSRQTETHYWIVSIPSQLTLNLSIFYYNFNNLTTPCGCNYRGIKMAGQKVKVVAKK